MAQHRIIVIGAGIVGVSIAHRLSGNGARVTLVEAREAPGLGVTAASFGWITCAAGDDSVPEPDYRRRLQAIEDYARLDRDFGGRLCAPCRGAIVWGATEDETRGHAQGHEERGSVVRLIGAAEIAEFEPMIAEPPALAARFPRERALDVAHACILLARAAREAGAETLFGETVLGLETTGGRVSGVRLSGGSLAADRVIVAAGAHSAALVADFMPDHGITTSPSALVTISVESGRLAHVLDGGGIEIRSRGNGDLVAACGVEDDLDDRALSALADDVLSRVRRLFPGMENPRVDHVQLGQRTMLADGRPLVSAARAPEGLYLAVAHPGVILAPEISRQVAELLAH